MERGYAKTTTNHVARVAGVSIGSLYQYFSNKDELVLAIINRRRRFLTSSAIRMPTCLMCQSLRCRICRRNDGRSCVDPKLTGCVSTNSQPRFGPSLDGENTAVTSLASIFTLKSEIVVDDVETAAYVLVVTVDSVIHSAFLGDIQPDLERLSTELVRLILRYLGVASQCNTGDKHGLVEAIHRFL